MQPLKEVKKNGSERAKLDHLLSCCNQVSRAGERRGRTQSWLKRVIPKIVGTGPLDGEMFITSVDDLPESKTIRDIADSGSYDVHTKPSTIEAYQVRKEAA
uniref:Uncharacterized protein n=1 Tax=Chrysemys picta bellii TaxID=8478 RepID=A0A8C3FV12_CHRPI